MSTIKLQKLETLIFHKKFVEAEAACHQIQRDGAANLRITELLIYIYLQTEQYSLASEILQNLFSKETSNRGLCDKLAKVCALNGDHRQASDCYKQYLQTTPMDVEAIYNYAFNLRHAGQFDQSIEQYEKALSLNISQPEEVLVNLAVIYTDHLRDDDKAEAMLYQALKLNPKYIPALFNLANLDEQRGRKSTATKHFQSILGLDPKHSTALARLADLTTFSDSTDPIVVHMEKMLFSHSLENRDKTDILFALGKAFDQCKQYTKAFEYYGLANKLNANFNPKFSIDEFTHLIEQIISVFSADWLSENQTKASYQPIFICGMFRSGSTLAEQILASHPKMTAGGELEFFVRHIATELSPFPQKVSVLTKGKLKNVGELYQQYVVERFPEADKVTDKRPDNFLFLGLIKAIFPQAKIIFTQREPLDNFLSVYFQHLSPSMNYATDLPNIAHYYSQQNKLMAHWKSLFPQSIYTLNYDELISCPEVKIKEMLNFLGLEWHADCLNFYQLDNTVKTASVLQVRQALYETSSGRWKNYEAQLLANLPDFDFKS